MKKWLWLLLALNFGCSKTLPSPNRNWVYAPASITAWSDIERVRNYPDSEVPPIIFDRIDSLGGAYLDLITLSRLKGFEGNLKAPADGLITRGSSLKLIGRAVWDWPVLVARKELDPEVVALSMRSGSFHLLGQDGEGPGLYIPVQDELVLVRLLEQWRAWAESEPSLPEQALIELGHLPVSVGVAEAEVSLLMRSQWESLKRGQKANVVVYDDLQLVSMAGDTVVAPWGLVSSSSDSFLQGLSSQLIESSVLPENARLSSISQGKARLLAHDIFPKKFGRKTATRTKWKP